MFDRPAAVLLDMDGTLIDSLPTLARAMNDVLVELGRDVQSVASMRQHMGHGLAFFVDNVLAATRGDRDPVPSGPALARLRSRYDVHCIGGVRPFDGVEAMLDDLAGRFRLAVCTNKPRRPTEAILDRLGWTDRFEVVAALGDVPVPKPDPALVWRALDGLGVGVADALLVGDSENDAGAARACGMRFVAVRWGYARGTVEGLGADVILERPAGLLNVL